MNRRTLLIGASTLALAAFAGGAVVLTRRREVEAEAAAAGAPAVDPSLLIRAHSPSFGPADAPVTLVEFFDPSCEACRAYHPVVQDIRRQFPNEVRVVLRYTVFHEGSDEAVRILEVARMQEKFEQVLEAILEKQPNWALHDGPQMDLAWRTAGAVGLELDKAESQRLSPEITGILNQDMADVEAVGIRQTPTFFLNGKRLENLSPEKLVAEVRQAVEGA
ncbi:thioredoxin domain-containing protein [Paracoccus sp. R12_1]|jgi:protein-disulfide isomerase|uniref:Thioredoxin domain-containing protein n=1 Tax=Paracoccus maritimus TaxID=2933292 RepID=A0ABT2KDV8_9RHOB|nr:MULTISPECIES: thioredoxin domain-containing protein [unclassified Paracoccus (in: a-proteobacteria)]MBO9456620.1 thioredoxin domain-containing protein [Paracoccus sp. R12_2]MBO9488242.1 thioredoxin domain-containing protein [Paracoccus sp. R12_1]MCT4334718.1 thioredoxin domain-containing protein [Paracoccus sp. YLB-12]PHQ72159.1 MAG: disulfide bond formation protein DsbA [Paracoccus sp. (in: a-proteobacteria)]